MFCAWKPILALFLMFSGFFLRYFRFFFIIFENKVKEVTYRFINPYLKMRHTPVLFILLISSLFHSSLLLKAQNTFDNQGNDSNLYSIQKAWYAAHPEQSIGKDGEEERFKRWEHNLISRTFPSGRPINQEMVWNEWNRFNATQQPKNYKKGIWSFRGPYQTPTGGGGNGRINCIEFMPGNTKTIFAGTPAGGLWKTTNEGLSWVCLTDKLPTLVPVI